MKAGIIVSGGILIYVGCAVIILRCHRSFIVNELIAFANQYDSLEKRILEELALPYAIMDMNGRMIWSNKVFAELTGKDQFYKKNVSTVFPDVTADKLPVADKKETAEISTRFGEKTYRISMQRVSLGEVVAKSELLENSNRNVSLIAMYLYDDTELKSYIKKNEDNKLVVALAYLDNYEEALESVEEVRRSLQECGCGLHCDGLQAARTRHGYEGSDRKGAFRADGAPPQPRHGRRSHPRYDRGHPERRQVHLHQLVCGHDPRQGCQQARRDPRQAVDLG